MPKTKEEDRHAIYTYLEAKYGKLDNDTLRTVSRLILHHEKALTKRQQLQIDRLNSMALRIKEYLMKAKTMPQTERIIGQTEGLILCNKWIRESLE